MERGAGKCVSEEHDPWKAGRTLREEGRECEVKVRSGDFGPRG